MPQQPLLSTCTPRCLRLPGQLRADRGDAWCRAMLGSTGTERHRGLTSGQCATFGHGRGGSHTVSAGAGRRPSSSFGADDAGSGPDCDAAGAGAEGPARSTSASAAASTTPGSSSLRLHINPYTGATPSTATCGAPFKFHDPGPQPQLQLGWGRLSRRPRSISRRATVTAGPGGCGATTRARSDPDKNHPSWAGSLGRDPDKKPNGYCSFSKDHMDLPLFKTSSRHTAFVLAKIKCQLPLFKPLCGIFFCVLRPGCRTTTINIAPKALKHCLKGWIRSTGLWGKRQAGNGVEEDEEEGDL
ncbi:hypothetical protein GGX14DRAFT_394011 [Mycena pura]|uniref:Uncharacterized protein n=1 Tax=Mycena pura TaxID=153505 RepID=A0AAD6YE55_9AGAR|nr:hypothetical protein GGX14DRAFT_394011 [Mycena pura]